MNEFFTTLWNLTNEMSPYLLLGFFISGMLHAFMPRKVYSNHLAKPTFGSVLKATIFGIPLPLCSCGVIPTAMSLHKEGASKGATVSFLVATPQTGVDSIAATYSVFGLPFALIRPIAALFTALISGVFVNRFDDRKIDSPDVMGLLSTNDSKQKLSFKEKTKLALNYGYFEMIQDLGKWLILGILVATIITLFVPDDFFMSFSQYPILSMIMVLLLSIPMYLCATGSIPIALALMIKGLSPGAALVLLMAGPATNAAAIIIIYNVLGKKTTFIYLSVLILSAVLFGLGIDYLMPNEWFTIHSYINEVCHTNNWMHWISIISSSILIMLILNAYIRKYIYKPHLKNINNMRQFYVEGMNCNHCKSNVEKSLMNINGVNDIVVDLSQGIVSLSSDVDDAVIIDCIRSLGFACKLK